MSDIYRNEARRTTTRAQWRAAYRAARERAAEVNDLFDGDTTGLAEMPWELVPADRGDDPLSYGFSSKGPVTELAIARRLTHQFENRESPRYRRLRAVLRQPVHLPGRA